MQYSILSTIALEPYSKPIIPPTLFPEIFPLLTQLIILNFPLLHCPTIPPPEVEQLVISELLVQFFTITFTLSFSKSPTIPPEIEDPKIPLFSQSMILTFPLVLSALFPAIPAIPPIYWPDVILELFTQLEIFSQELTQPTIPPTYLLFFNSTLLIQFDISFPFSIFPTIPPAYSSE